MHAREWVVVTEQSASVRTNGVYRTKSNVSDCILPEDSLCINFHSNQSSDFAIQTVMWFNQTLSLDQIIVLEAALLTQRKFWTPNNMQVTKQQHVFIHIKCLKLFRHLLHIASYHTQNLQMWHAMTFESGRCCLLRLARCALLWWMVPMAVQRGSVWHVGRVQKRSASEVHTGLSSSFLQQQHGKLQFLLHHFQGVFVVES